MTARLEHQGTGEAVYSRRHAAELREWRLQAEEFFAYESELLDLRRYEEWLDLLAEDITYEMPLRRSVKFREYSREFTDSATHGTMWIADDKVALEQRVRQLVTGTHWAEEPASRMVHMVTNVQVHAVGHTAGDVELECSCRFLVYRNRLDQETDVLAGRRLDRLRGTGDSWLVARREIQLAQSVLLAKNLTFFI